MGSSKKHKEKKDRKKHKKHRSHSRDRDSHKSKSHKSSHRKDRHKSSESDHEGEQVAKKTTEIPFIGEEEIDVDKLLDSQLSEDFTARKPTKKRPREEVVEELRRRMMMTQQREDSLERFATEQMLEEHGAKRRKSPSPPRPRREAEEASTSYQEPQLSLSITDTNKLRAKLGLKPLEVKEIVSRREQSRHDDSSSSREANRPHIKSRTVEAKREEPESHEPQLSLSIADTNKLRAKLGLKPLDEGRKTIPGLQDGGDANKEISKPTEEVFVKTENMNEKKRSDNLRDKLTVMKEKRNIEGKLRKTKGIADSDSDDETAASWIVKHQKMQEERDAAEKRAKLLEEMDAEFGIGALVDEEFDKKKAYTSQNLKGLTVGHDIDSFAEGQQVILTLKDKGVLEEEDDVLENVNFIQRELYDKNVENKKKKPDYRPYEEPEFDEFGILKKKNMLSKYDEEIEGEKKKSFKIGAISNTPYVSKEQELELIRMKLRQQNKITLEMPEMKVANEYYTPEDMVQFKKPKKKRRKVLKQSSLKADDLVPDAAGEGDLGSRTNRRRREIDEVEEDDTVFRTGLTSDASSTFGSQFEDMDSEMSSAVVDEDQAEKELYSALNKAKKLKQRKIMATAPEKVIELLSDASGGPLDPSLELKGVNIEMNSVAEFCRTLGEIPTYGQSGNREEEVDDMKELERELLEERQRQEEEALNSSAWNEVDVEEKPAEISMAEIEPILEEEPDISVGVAGALTLAMKKGYLDKEDKKFVNAAKGSTLEAQSYHIEEKFYEDDKFGKRDRYTGPVQDFKEKNNYRPEVKLEYIEKLDQDNKLKQMSSTDTPLNTVKLLQLKQKETQSPYIVLSGGNKTLTQTMISKVSHV